jgi:hypothetical protein
VRAEAMIGDDGFHEDYSTTRNCFELTATESADD